MGNMAWLSRNVHYVLVSSVSIGVLENAQSVTGRWLTVAWLDACYVLALLRSPWGRCLPPRYFKFYYFRQGGNVFARLCLSVCVSAR